MERSLAKTSRVLAEYVKKKAYFPTSYIGPDNNTLSSLPDYGISNAALPRGEFSCNHYKLSTKETIMSNRKMEIAKIAKEIKQIKAQLNKSADDGLISDLVDAMVKSKSSSWYWSTLIKNLRKQGAKNSITIIENGIKNAFDENYWQVIQDSADFDLIAEVSGFILESKISEWYWRSILQRLAKRGPKMFDDLENALQLAFQARR